MRLRPLTFATFLVWRLTGWRLRRWRLCFLALMTATHLNMRQELKSHIYRPGRSKFELLNYQYGSRRRVEALKTPCFGVCRAPLLRSLRLSNEKASRLKLKGIACSRKLCYAHEPRENLCRGLNGKTSLTAGRCFLKPV